MTSRDFGRFSMYFHTAAPLVTRNQELDPFQYDVTVLKSTLPLVIHRHKSVTPSRPLGAWRHFCWHFSYNISLAFFWPFLAVSLAFYPNYNLATLQRALGSCFKLKWVNIMECTNSNKNGAYISSRVTLFIIIH